MTESQKKNWVKMLIIVGVLLTFIILMRVFGLTKYISLENISKLNEWIKGFGMLGPVIYILMYVASCVFFLPGVPVTLLGGIAFGPVKGIIYVSIGSTLGAAQPF